MRSTGEAIRDTLPEQHGNLELESRNRSECRVVEDGIFDQSRRATRSRMRQPDERLAARMDELVDTIVSIQARVCSL